MGGFEWWLRFFQYQQGFDQRSRTSSSRNDAVIW